MDCFFFQIGFSLVPKRHDLLVEILTQEFEDIAISKDDMGSWTIPSGNLTIGDIRAHGKYLVLTYNRDEITTGKYVIFMQIAKSIGAQFPSLNFLMKIGENSIYRSVVA